MAVIGGGAIAVQHPAIGHVSVVMVVLVDREGRRRPAPEQCLVFLAEGD